MNASNKKLILATIGIFLFVLLAPFSFLKIGFSINYSYATEPTGVLDSKIISCSFGSDSACTVKPPKPVPSLTPEQLAKIPTTQDEVNNLADYYANNAYNAAVAAWARYNASLTDGTNDDEGKALLDAAGYAETLANAASDHANLAKGWATAENGHPPDFANAYSELTKAKANSTVAGQQDQDSATTQEQSKQRQQNELGAPACFRNEGIINVFPTFDPAGCAAKIGNIFLTLFARLVWLSGIFLNAVMANVLVGMRGLLDDIPAVNIAWTVLRNLANMFFIFVLLYAGISTMLQTGTNTKKLIVNVIIIALFINFSLFMTKVVIDASNITALFFYGKLQITDSPDHDSGISNLFMEKLKIQSIYKVTSDKTLGSGTGDTSQTPDTSAVTGEDTGDKLSVMNIIAFSFGGCVLFIVVAFIFFAGGVLFLLRFVILLLLMIFSPLAFIAYALPGTQGYFKKWLDMLLKQSFFAPAYMLIIYLTLLLLGNGQGAGLGSKLGTDSSFTSALSGNSGAIGVLLNYVIVIVLLTSSLLVAKQAGAKGASTVSKWGTSGRKYLQGKVARTAVRASGISTLEKKLDGTRFGNMAPVRALRNATTGALVDQKFGSKDSVKSMDKKYDKFVDKRTKQEEEAIKRKEENAKNNSTSAKTGVGDAKERLKKAQSDRDTQTDPTKKAAAEKLVKQREAEVAKAEKRAEKARTPVEKAEAERAAAEAEFNKAEAHQNTYTDPQKRADEIDRIDDEIEQKKQALAAETDPIKSAAVQAAIDESKRHLNGYIGSDAEREKAQQEAAEVKEYREKLLKQAQKKESEAPDEIRKKHINAYAPRGPLKWRWFKSLARNRIVEDLRKKKTANKEKNKGGGGGKPDVSELATQVKDNADYDDFLDEMGSDFAEKAAKRAKSSEE